MIPRPAPLPPADAPDAGAGAAEEQDPARPQQLDLPLQERLAHRDLAGTRRAVARRPPEHDVGDPHQVAIEPDGRQHAVEQLPARADEGLAAPVLLGPRRLADQHQPGGRAAVGET